MLGMLELGIIVHSIVIGVAFGAARYRFNTAVGYVVALSFHQLFEGIGIGTSIAGVKQQYPSLLTPRRINVMVGAFASTLPAGIAFGMVLARLPNFDNDSLSQRWLVGSLNSISGGILLYISLLHFLAEDFTRADLNQANKRALRWLMVAAMLAGMAIMTVLGIWA